MTWITESARSPQIEKCMKMSVLPQRPRNHRSSGFLNDVEITSWGTGTKFSYVHYMLFSTSFKKIAVAFKLQRATCKKTFPLGVSHLFSFLSWRLILKGLNCPECPLPLMSCPIDLSAGTLSVRCPTWPGIVFDTIMKRSGISIAPIQVRRTYTLPTNHRKLYALHIYLYFQPWIFSHREPHRCPSSESSGWLKYSLVCCSSSGEDRYRSRDRSHTNWVVSFTVIA